MKNQGDRLKETMSNPRRGEASCIGTVAGSLDQVSMEPAFLCSTDAAVNSKQAGRIARQAKVNKKAAVVFATHMLMGQRDLTPMGITVAQLSYCMNSGGLS